MANESRVFRLPAGMSTQVVANAVEALPKPQKAMWCRAVRKKTAGRPLPA